MTLFKLKAASCVLIEDDYNKNTLPLISELVENSARLEILCYEQPVSVWKNIFSVNSMQCYKEPQLDKWLNNLSEKKSTFIIDSINQMILDNGWSSCINYIRKLLITPKMGKLIIILHRDCLTNSKIQIQLNHIANAIVSYDKVNPHKIRVQIKKGGKFSKSEEIISLNTSSSLKLTSVEKEIISNEEPEKVLPNELSTFKIEVDQLQQLEKSKLKLPYMSKINEGKGKVYYEPDAVDDWDDEDPDDDLDI